VIRVDRNEQFPITVNLIDESDGSAVAGQTVYYDIRHTNDSPLSPPVNGLLSESFVGSGIYITTESISEAGNYRIYATCSGFNTNVEGLIVNEESIYEVTKSTHNYNISVEDVLRTNVSGTSSQIARNVPIGKTDYLVTLIKADSAVDWSNPISSGTVYAHYRSLSEELPYMMGGPL
jgi:hypothetical protein